MRFSLPIMLLSLAGTGFAALPKKVLTTGCHNDNCARALTGTALYGPTHVTQARSDCSSLLRTTITPAPSTVLVTTTLVSNYTAINLVRRQYYSPSFSLPAYASPCSNYASYAHECSCIGVTPTTITASAPVRPIQKKHIRDLTDRDR